VVILVSLPTALAHSWYPRHCCHDQDCRKVERIEKLPDGAMVMHAGSMHVLVPRGFFQQPSQDNDAHVCAYEMHASPLSSGCRRLI